MRRQRARQVRMDETLFQNTLKGKLAEEGAENVFMSEVGWATYLDEQGQSYAMNQKVSEADDGYFTPDAFSNPLKVIGSWAQSMKRVASDPLNAAFPSVTNDPDGKRTYGEGSEYKSRTHQLGKVYPPSGDGLFNLFGMPPTESGKDNVDFFEGAKEGLKNIKGPSLPGSGGDGEGPKINMPKLPNPFGGNKD